MGRAQRALSVVAIVAVMALAAGGWAQTGDPTETQLDDDFAAGLTNWWDMSGGFSLGNPGLSCTSGWGDALVYDQSGSGSVVITDSIPGAPSYDPADWYNFRMELDFVLGSSSDYLGVVWWIDDPANFNTLGVSTGGYQAYLWGAPADGTTPANGANLGVEVDVFGSTPDYTTVLENAELAPGDPEWTVYSGACYRMRVQLFCGELTIQIKRLDTGGDWHTVYTQTFGGNPPGVMEKVGNLGLIYYQQSQPIYVDNVTVKSWPAACEVCSTGWSSWGEGWTALDPDYDSARDRTAMVFRQMAVLHEYRSQLDLGAPNDWNPNWVIYNVDDKRDAAYATDTCVGGRVLADLPSPFENLGANVDTIRSYLQPMSSSVQVTEEPNSGALVFMPQHDADDPIPVFADGNTPIAGALMDVYDWYQQQIHDGSGGSDEGPWFRDPLAECRRWYVILITDGEESCAATQNAVCEDTAAGGRLRDAGVPVYTIGFSSSVSDTSPLKCLSMTGGLFQTAAQAEELLQALINILSQIDQVDRAFAPVAVTPQNSMTQTDRLIFLPRFIPRPKRSIWEGSLFAFGIDGQNPTIPTVTESGKTKVDVSQAKWNAKDVLLTDGASSRKIFYASPGAVPETRNEYDYASTSTSERDDLASWLGAAVSATHDELEVVMDFVTGEDRPDSESGDGTYQWLLGDIFHSTPVVVAAPGNYGYYLNNINGYVDDTGTTDPNDGFMEAHKYRRRVVLVGANDAMLHAFDGGFWDREFDGAPANTFDFGTGRELFAHIPREVMPTTWHMAYTADPDPEHRYSVDGNVTVDDVYISPDGGSASREWRTVAIYTLRRGGRSVVALDVTQPDPYSSGVPTASSYPGCLDGGTGCDGDYPTVLWEFTHSGLGETWSKPSIARIENSTTGEDIFIAFFGAGWDEGTGTRGNGVYGINIETGALIFHTEARSSTEILARVPGGVVALDTDDDGYTERLYFGDVSGGVWRIDTNPTTPSSGEIVDWSSKQLAFFGYDAGTDTYGTSDSSVQQFFLTPTLVPALFAGSDFMWGIAIGSGNREDIGDLTDVAGRFYFLLDDNDFASTGTLDESDLVRVGLNDDPMGTTALDPSNGDFGWYLELEGTEKVTAQAIVLDQRVQFPTFKPVPPEGTTGGSSGSGDGYVIDPTKVCIVEKRTDDPFDPASAPDLDEYPATYQAADEDAARAWLDAVDGDGNSLHPGDYLGECKICRAAGTVRLYNVSYYNADPPDGEDRYDELSEAGFISGGTVYTVGDKTIASWMPMDGPPINTEAVALVTHRVTNWRQE